MTNRAAGRRSRGAERKLARTRSTRVPWVLPLLLGLGLATPAIGAELAVTVREVAGGEGHVMVAVCTPDTFLGTECPHIARAPATPGAVQVVVPGVEPGVYAVQVYHDANDNRDVDRNFLGVPLEGVGFSRDAEMRFGPPAFADAAIEVSGERAATDLTLRYFKAE